MSWNYRIVRYSNGEGFGIHVVDYNEQNEPISMSVEAVRFTADTLDDLRSSIALAQRDAWRRPIFDEPPDWRKPDGTTGLGECQRLLRMIYAKASRNRFNIHWHEVTLSDEQMEEILKAAGGGSS